MSFNTDNLIIGIIGKQRAGKDTLGDYLVHKYGFNKVAFAEPVYKLAREYFGMKDKDRELLVQLAMHLRAIDKDVWLRKAVEKIESFTVITDLRFENEYEYLKSLPNAWIIKVEANQEIRAQREGYSLEHEDDDTETRLLKQPVHYKITNNTTKADALNQLDYFMDFLMCDEGLK